MLGATEINAQEVTVQIKVTNKKTGDYFIEVADRNCGAQSNGINSYGEYYPWSNGTKASELKASDAAGKACAEFRGAGHTDWRLPAPEEVRALMEKCKTETTYATIQSDKGDTTAVVYLPYAGIIELGKAEPIRVGKYGYFWTAASYGGTAVVLELSKNFANNPGNSKKERLSVRCVRTVN